MMKKTVIFAVLVVAACGGKKSGGTTGPTGGGDTGAGAASSEPAVNGCTTYKDMSATGSWQIPWDPSVASSDLRCVQIKVNQTVAFFGHFTPHPLKAAGGTTPSPLDNLADAIANPDTEQELANFEFKTPGTYGYICGNHPEMTGAIKVVP